MINLLEMYELKRGLEIYLKQNEEFKIATFWTTEIDIRNLLDQITPVLETIEKGQE